MTVPRTAADVLAEHVTLEVECIDRMFLNVYQPTLQHVNGVVGFLRGHRGHPFASSALMDPISKESALDNGFAACDPQRLQAICDGLDAEAIDALLRKWLAILLHPFTAADRAAGYRYDLSILQAEFSVTQMLDRPCRGECSSTN